MKNQYAYWIIVYTHIERTIWSFHPVPIPSSTLPRQCTDKEEDRGSYFPLQERGIFEPHPTPTQIQQA